MDLFKNLVERYSNYETKIEIDEEDTFVIINPYWEENIEVKHRDDGFIFFFSYHHAHFEFGVDIKENFTDLVAYINDFLGEKLIAYKISENEKYIRGGQSICDRF